MPEHEKPWSLVDERVYAPAMFRRALLQALLILTAIPAFPALAQAPAGGAASEGGDDEWGDDDDEWGDEDDGAVLGDDLPRSDGSAQGDDAAAADEADEASPTEAAPGTPAGDEPPAPDAAPSEPASSTSSASPAVDGHAPDASADGDTDTYIDPDDGTDVDDATVEGFPERRVGDPIPLTRREPLLPSLGLEVGIRYGLVGTGPTRFVDDIRFGVFDWLELRTALAPYPSSLMARVGIGRAQSPFGVLLLEAGLAHLDAGLRLVPDAGEAEVGVRAHVEAVAAYQIAFLERFSLYAAAHLRSRFSMLSNDEQHAFAATAQLSYDVLPYLAVSGGLGYAQTLFGTPVREIAINFVETDRPGMSHFLARDDGETYSLTVPLALTYGRVENFDVDIFATTRVWPKLDVIFGAGVRWRWWFGRKPWEPST